MSSAFPLIQVIPDVGLRVRMRWLHRALGMRGQFSRWRKNQIAGRELIESIDYALLPGSRSDRPREWEAWLTLRAARVIASGYRGPCSREVLEKLTAAEAPQGSSQSPDANHQAIVAALALTSDCVSLHVETNKAHLGRILDVLSDLQVRVAVLEVCEKRQALRDAGLDYVYH